MAVAWFLVVRHRESVMRDEVAATQREVDELQQYIREVDDYKAKKAELERKIDVINTLKENQRGPVLIMDQVSRALPELLWLTSMDVNPSVINIRGAALNMSAVANFMDNLDRVEEFQEPVLVDATERTLNQRTEVYDFNLNFNYSFKKPGAPAGETAPAAAPNAPPTKGAIGKAKAAKAAVEKEVQ